jgi:N4-gp56 family major capsid protein
MKETVQELAAVVNATDTASVGIAGVQGSLWLKEILKAAKQRMFFEQFAYVTDIQKGHKDITIPLNTTNKSMTDDATETSRTYTEIDNITSVTLTPADHKYGVIVSETVVRTSQVDVVAFARDQLAYDMAVDIDTAIGAAIVAEDSPAATLYGGDATATNNLEAGDILTTDLVAEADRYLRSNGWIPEPGKPFVLFAAAVNLFALKKDSQFVNASEYGSNEVVMNGEIGKYLGIKVISTEQVPSASDWGAGANLSGHQCIMVKAKVSYALAWSLRPGLDMEYDKELAAWKIYMDSAYATDSLQGSAIVVINVLDA